ncbi:MAG: FAD-dependent oxidoreductase [Chloroflexi bacterium]|nr:FAD-dependent oxidoreductase [Chloroflexota bacterium]
METPFPRLFSPLRIGARTARNRIVSTPHTTGFGVDGYPQERWFRYEREKARGGCGIVMMFGSASVHPSSHTGLGGIQLWDPGVIPHLQRLAGAVHEHGALCLAQLAHWGRAGAGVYTDSPLLAPSDEPDESHHGMPRTLTRRQIRELVDAYARAAVHVQRGGYDGVDISYWGGHLIEQFLSPGSNHRTDEYGGSLENRMRFGLEVLAAVRQAVGPDFIVGGRISGDQFDEGGLTLEDMKVVAARLAGTGQLDYLTVSGSSSERYRNQPALTPTYYLPLGVYNSFAAEIRSVVDIPVIVAGRIVHPAQAEEILSNGWADAVAMTRAMLADPEMPKKAMAGRADDIRVCTGASEACIGAQTMGRAVTCIQNPTAGREAELAEVHPAAQPRRVVVVGGGVAGLEAARMAALRGHRVTLFEGTDRLGGQVLALCRAPQREAHETVATWLAGQVQKAGVEVRLRCRATAASVLAEQPDVVVVATGARPRKLDVPTAPDADVVGVEDVLLDRASPGPRCLVVDYHGHMPGPSAAEYLADRGRQIEIVTRFFTVGQDVEPRVKTSVYTRLYQKGVTISPLTVVREIGRGWVRLANTLTGQERTVEVDTVVAALGGRSDDALYHELEGQGPEVHVVGDALAPRRVHDAILSATRVARAI